MADQNDILAGEGRPQRVQLSRAKGWRMPPNTIKVDRTTRWGNPARVVLDGIWGTGEEDEDGEEILQGPWACLISGEGRPLAGWWFATETEALAKAIEYFRYLVTKAPACAEWRDKVAPLRGKNLACWCKPNAACHADVLLEIANV